nr:nitrite reductase small subunit NirD [Mammaliicoccus sp. Marseille-Q6498]
MMATTNEKIRIAHISELEPLIGKKVIVGDIQIGLFLTEDGDIRAINNICPHKQGPLSEGTVSGHYVYCPLHDRKIDLQTGQVQEPDDGCVSTYPVEVINGDIYVCL